MSWPTGRVHVVFVNRISAPRDRLAHSSDRHSLSQQTPPRHSVIKRPSLVSGASHRIGEPGVESQHAPEMSPPLSLSSCLSVGCQSLCCNAKLLGAISAKYYVSNSVSLSSRMETLHF